MANERRARNPLLYIQQPDVKRPNVHMQASFFSNSRKENKAENKTDLNPGKKKRKRRIRPTYQRDESIEEIEGDNPIQEEREITNQEKFKQMTVKEKVMYFTEQPRQMPRVTCEIKAKDKTYYGKIITYEDDEVIIQLKRGTRERLLLTEIVDIHMIGF